MSASPLSARTYCADAVGTYGGESVGQVLGQNCLCQQATLCEHPLPLQCLSASLGVSSFPGVLPCSPSVKGMVCCWNGMYCTQKKDALSFI